MNNIIKILRIVLIVGIIFSFSNIAKEYIDFYNVEGTIFKLSDCKIPNPITTPCFYGALGFVIAFKLTDLISNSSNEKKVQFANYLMFFLLFGTLFAWYNNWSTFIDFYLKDSTEVFGCTGKIITSPFTTPCFIGALIFTCSLLLSIPNKKEIEKINKEI